MRGVLSAESAVLHGLHTIRMSLLILSGVIVTLLAFGACQCDLCTHFYSISCPRRDKMLFFVSLLPGCSVPGRPFSEHKKKTCDNLAVKLYHKEKDPSTVLTDLSRTVVCAMSVRPFPHRSVLLGVGFDTVIVIQEIQDLFSARFVQFVKSSHHSLGGKLLGEVIALVQGCEIYRIQ